MKKSISQKDQIDNQKVEKVETVTEEFTGKNLTRFGGAGLIRRFFKRQHIQEKIEQGVQIEGRRESKYGVGSMLVSLLYGMFLGYPRPSQMEVLSTDKVFQKIAGLISFPVQSTISRFLDSLKVVVARQIAVLNFDLLLKFREGFRAFLSLTLDLDSHVSPVYGRQQRAGRGYNPKKKGRRSYHPLFCFISETRDYLAGLLRSGKHHTSYQAIPFLKGILKKLRISRKSGCGRTVVFSPWIFLSFWSSDRSSSMLWFPSSPGFRRRFGGLRTGKISVGALPLANWSMCWRKKSLCVWW